MKTIALVALLGAAACSKNTVDCEPAIAKGVDDLTTTVKSRAVNPQMQERITTALGKLKATLIKRCTEDKWSPDAVACFANIPSMKGLQECEAKLTDEQRKKVEAERRSLMRGGAGPGQRMPDLPGHPQVLGPPDGSGAPGAGDSASLGSAADPGAVSPPPTPPPSAAPAGSTAPPPAPGSASGSNQPK